MPNSSNSYLIVFIHLFNTIAISVLNLMQKHNILYEVNAVIWYNPL
jgi:hypothetical protein